MYHCQALGVELPLSLFPDLFAGLAFNTTSAWDVLFDRWVRSFAALVCAIFASLGSLLELHRMRSFCTAYDHRRKGLSGAQIVS